MKPLFGVGCAFVSDPRHDSADRQSELEGRAVAIDQRDPTVQIEHTIDGAGHRARIAAERDHVEVGARRRRQAIEPLGDARDDGGRHPSAFAIDQRREKVALGERALLEPRDHGADEPDHRVALARRQREVFGTNAPAPREPRARRREHARPDRLWHPHLERAARRGQPPPRDDTHRARLGQVFQQTQVGVSPRRDPAEVGLETVVRRGVQRHHPVRVDRGDAAPERDPQQMIGEPVRAHERRHRSVRRQHRARCERGRLLQRVEQTGEIGTQRRFAQHHRNAQAGATEHFLRGDGLVIGRHAARGDRGKLLGRGAGGMAFDTKSPACTSGQRVSSPMATAQG